MMRTKVKIISHKLAKTLVQYLAVEIYLTGVCKEFDPERGGRYDGSGGAHFGGLGIEYL